MKFFLGDKVRVKKTGEIGEIKQCKHEICYHGDQIVDTIKYYVDLTPYNNWIKEEDLTHEYEFTAKFELNLLNLLIDANLGEKNYKMVKKLNKLKQQYIKNKR